jgi:PAS domain S-box-containing protein
MALKKNIQTLPIKVKMILIVMVITLVCLLCTCTAFLLFDLYHAKKDLVTDIKASGRLIADRSSAALAFNDVRLAEENLSALRTKPLIGNAWILDDQNEEFAKYGEDSIDPALLPKLIGGDGSWFQDDLLYYYGVIFLDSDPIGTLVLSRSMQDYRTRVNYYIIFMLIMMMVASLVALMLSWRLQLYISRPLLHLAGVAKEIGVHKDYSIRAAKTSDDEIGLLVDAFNNMLNKIEEHDVRRKQSEESLRLERLLLRVIIDHLPDAVYTKDTQCRKTLANFADVLNLGAGSEEQVLGRTDFDFYPKELAEKFYADDQLVIGLGEPLLNREECVIVDGRKKWMMTSKIPLRDINDRIVGLIGIGRDITDSKEVAARLKDYYDKLESVVEERTAELIDKTTELERARDQAESADRLKSAFLATMSHELRTPLNSIIGFTGILKQGRPGPLNEEQYKQLNLIQTSARHLLSLINDVLDLSKIEAGQLIIRPEVVELGEIIQKVVDINTTLADDKKLFLNVNMAPGIGRITTDRQRLTQVLVNLVNNAIKFTEKGSVTIDVKQESGSVRIKVIDTGMGIEPDKINVLFKPFIQIDSGTTRKHEGTGLGLSISLKLLNLMGGTITVESEYQKGSTFIVTLPIQPIIPDAP